MQSFWDGFEKMAKDEKKPGFLPWVSKGTGRTLGHLGLPSKNPLAKGYEKHVKKPFKEGLKKGEKELEDYKQKRKK